ncbi:MAG: carboxypeptidase-like regulatory domain-containing protein [Janthinobacterium lividum]
MKRVVPNLGTLFLLVCFACSDAHAQSDGTVGGVVRDLHGAPQMGALVELLSGDATVVARTFTDDRGRYSLISVAPGNYELRASAAFLLPAFRTNLRLHAGVAAMANLTMTAMFEVGGWFPAKKRGVDDSADDWRWTLRSTANRPILRISGEDDLSMTSPESRYPSPAKIQGQVSMLLHEGEFANGGLHQVAKVERSEIGGTSETMVADLGDLSPSITAPPVALLTEYRRHDNFGGESRVVASFQSHPEISSPGSEGLQAVSLGASKQFAVGDAVMIDAGTLLSAERLLKSRTQSAPFLRIVVSPEPGIAIMYRFASVRQFQNSDDLDHLQSIPGMLSNAQGEPIAVRQTHQEISVAHKSMSDTETVSIYQDGLPWEGIQGLGVLPTSDSKDLPILSDTSTGTFRVAVPGYTARGMSASWTHELTSNLSACFKADLGSALARGDEPLTFEKLGSHSNLKAEVAPALTASMTGTVVRSGTRFSAQYRWQPSNTLDEVNAFNTTPDQAYLGFLLKQRLWSGHRLRGMDAILAATNLLEEGYQPVMGTDGRTLFLTQAARTLQAGLSFSF